MCCFCLHFSDFNVLFFKKIKNLLQFTFEKNKKREKNNFKKIPDPPPRISNGPSLMAGKGIPCLLRGGCLNVPVPVCQYSIDTNQ